LYTVTVQGVTINSQVNPNAPGPAGHYVWDIMLNVPLADVVDLPGTAALWADELTAALNISGHHVTNVKISAPTSTDLRIEFDMSSWMIVAAWLVIIGILALIALIIKEVDVGVTKLTQASNPLVWLLYLFVIIPIAVIAIYYVYRNWPKVERASTRTGRSAESQIRSAYRRIKGSEEEKEYEME